MSLTLKEAVGQLIIGRLAGTELDDDTKACLKSGTIGGITIFKENVASQEQLMNVCDSIRKLCWHQAVIAVDQEGGPVQRLDEIISPLPSAMALGNLDDIDRLKFITGLSGKQLRLLGFNCVFAPVLDVNTNPANPIIGTRAAGDDPQKVARLGAVSMRAFLEAGVLPVAKHFPGHGDTDSDSHLSLPRLAQSRQRLESMELVPFAENVLTTPALLVAHLWLECFDKEELPATLSYNVTTRLLKEDLGYQNLVVSDDMMMKAITNKWGLEEASILALAAGVDLLLTLTDATACSRVHEAVLKAVADGRLCEERIFQACRARNAALKKLPHYDETDKNRRLAMLQRSVAASKSLLIETSAAAISVKRGQLCSVFAGTDPIHIYIPALERYPLDFVGELQAQIPSLQGRLVEHRFSPALLEPEIEKLALTASGNCILVSFRAAINKAQIELAHRLQAGSTERLLIAADVPYDLDLISAWENAAVTYDPSNLAVQAFARRAERELKSSNLCPGGI